ncbi:MAG: alpha/beta hydrolase [Myxococcales bacterium]|nr:alpha/beta hydrolase [Myxococcales bacterium]
MSSSPRASARVVDIVWFMGAVLGAGARRFVARLVRGPRRAAWSAKLEAFIAMQRASYSMLPKLGIDRFHRVSQAVSPSSTSGVACAPVAADGVRGHWLTPADHAKGPVVLYFHGGGYIFGSLRTHGPMIGALARAAGLRTFALDYRLAPEHPKPAALEDALAAYHWLIEQQGVAPEQLVLAGDSAGGNLVLVTLLALRDAGAPLPAAGVAISPWVDLENSGASFQTNAPYDFVTQEACNIAAAAYLAGADPRAADASPLRAELSGLPPLLVHAGAAETLVDQIQEFCARARAAGVDVTLSVYDDMVHVWHMLFSFLPAANEALAEIGAYARARTRHERGVRARADAADRSGAR